jgi:predicted membrane protein
MNRADRDEMWVNLATMIIGYVVAVVVVCVLITSRASSVQKTVVVACLLVMAPSVVGASKAYFAAKENIRRSG